MRAGWSGLPPSLRSPPLPLVSLPPSSPFLSSLPHSADCQKGGESTKQQRGKGECVCTSVCVCASEGKPSEGRSRSIVAVVCLCFGCSAYRTLGERSRCRLMLLRLQQRFLANIFFFFFLVCACVWNFFQQPLWHTTVTYVAV